MGVAGFLENEPTRSNQIKVCGYIGWQDINNYYHPAKNVTVYLTDDNDSSVKITQYTNDAGYYSIIYPVLTIDDYDINIFVEPDSEIIGVRGYYTFIQKVKIFSATLHTGQTTAAPYSFVHYTNQIDDEPNAVFSIYQSLVLMQDFVYQITNSYMNKINAELFPDYSVDGGHLEARFYHHVYPNEVIFDEMYMSLLDAYEWDKTENVYSHYIACYKDIINDYNPIIDPVLENTYVDNKVYKIETAWGEGWCYFLPVYAQALMNASNFNIPYVGDNVYRDIGNYNNIDICMNIETFTDLISNRTIYKGETNAATVAAILLDFFDDVDSTDHDQIWFYNTTLFNFIFANQSKTLSQFINSIYDSTAFSTLYKLLPGTTLEWFNISPNNVNVVDNQTFCSVYATMPGSGYKARITIYSPSYTQLWQSGWYDYFAGYVIGQNVLSGFSQYDYVYFVVEGKTNEIPVTGPYWSDKFTFNV